jgi:type IV secretion system protein VirD4
MSVLDISCPWCGKEGHLPKDLANRKLTCRSCKKNFKIPVAAADPVEAEAPSAVPSPPPVKPASVDSEWSSLGIDTTPSPLQRLLPHGIPWLLLNDVIPILARVTLIGCFVWFGFRVYNLPTYMLVIAGVLLLYRQMKKPMNFGNLLGSAKWQTREQLKANGLLQGDGLILGRARDVDQTLKLAFVRLFTSPVAESDAALLHFLGALTRGKLGFRSNKGYPLIRVSRRDYVHLLTVAPTAAGKGVGVVLPNLLCYPHSVMVIDIKGENHELTAEQRERMGQTVIRLDPFGLRGPGSACLNPLDLIAADSPTIIEDSRILADALIIRNPQSKDPYWDEMSVLLVQSLIVMTACHAPMERRNLQEIRDILCNREKLNVVFDMMTQTDAVRGMLARLGGQLKGIADKNEKEFSSILSSTNRHLNFLDSPIIEDHIKTTDFDVRGLFQKMSIYLILPAAYITSHVALMRLWINCLLLVVKQAGASEKDEVLFLLDEVAQLKEMQPLEEAVSLLRSYGLRMWFICQSVKQLEVNFPGPRAEVILSNCGTKQFFGINDIETAEYVSKMIGKTTIATPNVQSGLSSSVGGMMGQGSRGRSSGTSYGAAERDLIRPEEVMRSPGDVFILQQGKAPILASRVTYYENPAEFTDGPVARAVRPAPSFFAWILFGLGLLATLNYAKASIDISALWTSRESSSDRSWSHDVGSDHRTSAGGYRAAPAPEPLFAECPSCQQRAPVPDGYSGQVLRCRGCGTEFFLPVN